MIWGTGGSVIKISKDQISEGIVCHTKELEFYSGDVGDPLKETMWRVNRCVYEKHKKEAIA